MGYHDRLVDPQYPFSYVKGEIPPTYRCLECGAVGCNLWRDWGNHKSGSTLLCAVCAALDQCADISTINDEGCCMVERGLTDQIGSRVPAVPREEDTSFWNYGDFSTGASSWWHKLPSTPQV